MKSFGVYLRERRERAGVSLRETARRAGMCVSHLHHVEVGITGASAEKIAKLAGIIGEDADRLLALAGHVPPDVRDLLLARPELCAKIRKWVKA